MNYLRLIKILLLGFFITILNNNNAYSEWLIDHDYGFKIDVPASWSTNSYNEGSDKVHDLTSQDENIFIQIRSFEAGEGIDAQMLANLFDEGLIAEGAKQENMSNEELNGIPGVMGVYTTNYEGTDMGIITFSIVSDNNGYLIFTVVPLEMFEQKVDEADAVLTTFTLLSKSSHYNDPEDDQAQNGLGGITGSTSSKAKGGGQNYVTISGGSINGTFNFSESGSYPIENQQTVVIRGLDDSGTNALEIYLYNYKGTGTFEYGDANAGGKRFVMGAVDGRAPGKQYYAGSGECTITEYREGGMIKGYFNASVGGHDIEGCFSLPLSTPKMPGGF